MRYAAWFWQNDPTHREELKQLSSAETRAKWAELRDSPVGSCAHDELEVIRALAQHDMHGCESNKRQLQVRANKLSQQPAQEEKKKAIQVKKPKVRDPNQPKRPLTAFFLYCNEVRSGVEAATHALKMKLIGQMWRGLNAEEAAPYHAEAKVLRAVYDTAMQAYRSSSTAVPAKGSSSSSPGTPGSKRKGSSMTPPSTPLRGSASKKKAKAAKSPLPVSAASTPVNKVKRKRRASTPPPQLVAATVGKVGTSGKPLPLRKATPFDIKDFQDRLERGMAHTARVQAGVPLRYQTLKGDTNPNLAFKQQMATEYEWQLQELVGFVNVVCVVCVGRLRSVRGSSAWCAWVVCVVCVGRLRVCVRVFSPGASRLTINQNSCARNQVKNFKDVHLIEIDPATWRKGSWHNGVVRVLESWRSVKKVQIVRCMNAIRLALKFNISSTAVDAAAAESVEGTRMAKLCQVTNLMDVTVKAFSLASICNMWSLIGVCAHKHKHTFSILTKHTH